MVRTIPRTRRRGRHLREHDAGGEDERPGHTRMHRVARGWRCRRGLPRLATPLTEAAAGRKGWRWRFGPRCPYLLGFGGVWPVINLIYRFWQPVDRGVYMPYQSWLLLRGESAARRGGRSGPPARMTAYLAGEP